MGELLGYARVSTNFQNPALQLDALQEVGCTRVFTDEASGVKANRPQLVALLEYAREGDTVVVWKLDRLGRSLSDLITMVQGFHDRGIEFRSLREALDTSSPGGRLMFHLFAAIAQFERDLISERTYAGLAAARARGRKGGRPSGLSTEQRELIASMWTAGDQVAVIARTVGTSRATVYRHLSSTK